MPDAPNTLRGGFEDYGVPVWAGYREAGRTREIDVGGFTLQAKTGVITLRDSAWARSITTSDQAVLDQPFEVIGTILPEQPDGMIRLEVTAAPSRAMYAREMEARGEVVTVRRTVPNGPPIEVTARAIVTGFQPEELVGGINVGERKIILFAEDLERKGFPIPPRSNDRILVRDRALNVIEVDGSTHLYAGVLNAYEIRASGAG